MNPVTPADPKCCKCGKFACHTVNTVDSAGTLVEGGPSLHLCDEHFDWAMRCGYITEPYMGYKLEARNG